MICDQVYKPVCGRIQVQCIKAPCPPVRETFSNRCHAEQRGAFDIEEGVCEERPTEIYPFGE